MALGSNSGQSKIYLTIGFGKFRQKTLENKNKVDKDTPGAVRRETQSGAESWALEHDYVSGYTESVFYKEDKEYGNSFEVVISDVADTYQLSFSEDSRFWFDFAKKLPLIDKSAKVVISAYDFTNKEGKRVVGIGVSQNGVKLASYYEKKNEDGTWKLLHGFPDSKGVNFKDKDETKVYFINVKKFLRAQFQELFADKYKAKDINKEPESHAVAAPIVDEPESDLPF